MFGIVPECVYCVCAGTEAGLFSFVDGEWQDNHADAMLESSTHRDTDHQHYRDNNYLHFCSIFHPQLLLCSVTDSSLMKPQRSREGSVHTLYRETTRTPGSDSQVCSPSRRWHLLLTVVLFRCLQDTAYTIWGQKEPSVLNNSGKTGLGWKAVTGIHNHWKPGLGVKWKSQFYMKQRCEVSDGGIRFSAYCTLLSLDNFY